MSLHQSTWRVLRATGFRDLRGQTVTLSYDDNGLGIAATDIPAALDLPWRQCRTRLTRRSNTWELTISSTPWGNVTLTTFRPAISATDLEFWESLGVLWSRWRWSPLSVASVVMASLCYVAISIFMAHHSVTRMAERSLPSLADLPFSGHVDHSVSALAVVTYPPNEIFTRESELRQPTRLLRETNLLGQHAQCTGIPTSRDRIFGLGGPTPAAAGYSSVFQAKSDRTFRTAVFSEVFGRASAVRRDARQLALQGVPECVAATYGRLLMRVDSAKGRVVTTDSLNVATLSRATVHAAHATMSERGKRQEVFVALVTYGRYRVTVMGVGQRRTSDENIFAQMVSTVAQKITGEPVSAA